MDSIIVGTAGHIDHGKTALVKALTGHDTDTLAEEKARGISINLGFTGFRLPSGRTLGIVDVPGHEKFIKNMLAGATGIDVALIIIAANEGIMPQTREHIDILSYLNIRRSLIVLTKADLVDEEFMELVREDVESYIEGTFLADAAIVEVDSISGRGIDRLIAELERLTENLEKRSFTKKPRMNIDRVFSVKGHGTVVTGTLMEGIIRTEDEVVVYPAGIDARVRNLQVHDCDVEKAYAGQRTAINLSGVAVTDIRRGNTVAMKDAVYVTNRIDVRFSIVKSTKLKMNKYYQLKLYVGSAEEVGRFIPITAKSVKAGDEGYAQIVLDHEIAVLKGDRFVLRTISPVTTIGGGIIIDPQPQPYKKITEALIEAVKLKDSPSDTEIAEQFVRQNPFVTGEEIAAFINQEPDADFLETLISEGALIRYDKTYIHKDWLTRFQYEVETLLAGYHKEHALRAGIPKAELFEKLNLKDKKRFEFVLQYLVEQKSIRIRKNLICLDAFEPVLTPDQQKLKADFLKQIGDSRFALLNVKDLTNGDKQKQQMLEFILTGDYLVLPGQYILEGRLYEEAKAAAQQLFTTTGVIKLPEFRDAIGASRKYALMILERMDQEKYTRRQGEDRVLINK